MTLSSVSFLPDTLLDVSRPLREGMPVWPGDEQFRRRVSTSRDAVGAVTVSALALSSHAGTHVDAPAHVDPRGAGVERLELWRFAGPATVVDARGRQALEPELVAPEVLESGRRLLFRTDFDGGEPGRAPAEHAPYLTVELARALASAPVPLVGLDGPSADPFGSIALAAHRILAAAGVAILENLDLRGTEPGNWVLLAMPLRLNGCDGSPVRAVLARERSG